MQPTRKTEKTNANNKGVQGIVDQFMPIAKFAHKNWPVLLVGFFLIVGAIGFRTFQRAVTCAPVNPDALPHDTYDSHLLSCLPAEKHISWLVSLPFSIGFTALLALGVLWFAHLLRLTHGYTNRDDQGFARPVRVSEFFEEINIGLMMTAAGFIAAGAVIGFILGSLG